MSNYHNYSQMNTNINIDGFSDYLGKTIDIRMLKDNQLKLIPLFIDIILSIMEFRKIKSKGIKFSKGSKGKEIPTKHTLNKIKTAGSSKVLYYFIFPFKHFNYLQNG